ncbi:MAG: hypothetical protein J6O50_03605 [Ruminiclostridium sp.]|nr:hypothetical protein [Ruminiclostridium sp.]
MRFGKYRSDEKVLHDEYFGDQPSAAFLLTARLVLLCILSGSFVMIFCDLYGYEGMGYIPAAAAAAASGAVYILASFFPPAIIYGAVVAASAGVFWILREKILLLSTYLWDWLMLKLDSRLLHTGEWFIHNVSRLRGSSAETEIMHTAVFWAAIALAVLCSVLFTSAVRTRFHFTVPALAVTIISAPAVAAEIAAYFPSYIAFVVAVFGLEAVRSSYELDSGFIYGSLTSAHLSDLRADHDYRKRTRLLTLGKKVSGDAERYHRYSGNMIAMTVISALVFFGAGFIIPEGKGINYQEFFDTITAIGTETANTIGDVFGITFGKADDRGYFSSDSYGEVSGSISLRPPGDSDRPVLEVTLSRGDIPVYLRGDIGVDYSGNSWTSVSQYADRYNRLVGGDFYPEAEYQVFRRFLAWDTKSGIDPESAMPLQMVSVRYMRNTRVVFQPVAPFELSYKASDKYDYFGDFVLRTRNGFVKTFDSLALTPAMESGIFGSDIIGTAGSGAESAALTNGNIFAPDMTSGDYINGITAYRGFVEEMYKQYSADPAAEQLSVTVARDYVPQGNYSDNEYRYALSNAFCDYFRDNFTYSLSADGSDEDMLGTFLNETHTGHCALFATAMTLGLRQFGVPARYVTGYVAYPGGERDADGNYRQILTERQLHAWTEVYFRGIGWLPFDPTEKVPGYAETVLGKSDSAEPAGSETSGTTLVTAAPEPETEASEAETTEPAPEDTAVPEDTSAPSGSVSEPVRDDGSDLWLRLLPIIVTMIVIIALGAVVVLFFRNLAAAEDRMIKSFRQLPPSEAAALMYRFTMRLLEMKGLVPGNEQLYDFAERVDGSIELKGLNYFLMDVIQIFEKAEFGDPQTAPVSEDEREAVYRYAAAVYSKVMSDATAMKRFSMKISLFL